MNALELQPMTEKQFAHFRLSGCESYASTSPHYVGMPTDHALKLVLEDFDSRLAPDGLKTAGQHFLAILYKAEQVGYLHFGEFPRGSKSVYAWNFHIFNSWQRRGFASAAMPLAQQYLRDNRYTKIALNVMATNPIAIRLYEKFGFTVTQVNMERELK